MFIIFDTETTGLPLNYHAPLTDLNNWPRCVQLAWQLHDVNGKLLGAQNHIVFPDGYSIPFNAVKVHGISTEKAQAEGLPLSTVMQLFLQDVQQAKYVVGHNIEFDLNIVGAEFLRLGWPYPFEGHPHLDTKEWGTDFCQIPGGKGGRYKWPTLEELHRKLFNSKVSEAHDAAFDVEATARCFFEMLKLQVIPTQETHGKTDFLYEAPELGASNFIQPQASTPGPSEQKNTPETNLPSAQPFVHFHVHSQYSVLQSTSEVEVLLKKALEHGSQAMALTENGNMMSAFVFSQVVDKHNKKSETPFKAILGAELNVARDRFNKESKDDGFPVVFWAKNKNGYHNLAHLVSMAHTEGFYYVPRIDRDILIKFKEDIMVSTGGLWGEVPYLILNVGEEKAEEAFLWWKEQFQDDFYAELLRHGIEEENVVNEVLLRFCTKHGVKYFAANNTYYTTPDEADAQDALLCVKDGEQVSKPKKYMGKRGREFRFGFPNNQFYFKSPDEMAQQFADLPEALSTTLEMANKCERYSLGREVLLPKFDIPQAFLHAQDEQEGTKHGENAFLRHLAMEGAVKRYGQVTPELQERLDFELKTIEQTGYPGYFLIVQDFCNKAREMGVSVGPGRGSAAGSVVAYCIGITNVDPVKYDLLFERFLNPERVSMPDIDIDFDDEGRGKVIDYVREKYSKNAVAQIITYGTMAAKSAVKDSGRVLELPLGDTNAITALIPDNSSLRKIVKKTDSEIAQEYNGDDLVRVKKLRELSKGNGLEARVIQMASVLEGSIRNTGIHACGVIITPGPIANYVPVATAKDSDMWCTQFDNDVVEKAGLLKMDFLGLKTLTIIKTAQALIKKRFAIEVDVDNIPLDDELTYQLFQRGDTVSIFQYESPGMQKHLRDLKPTVFEDLIAMNALYRPGPLEYIPSFIRRKHGKEPIQYDLPEMEGYLKDTYGITVYQEQVMLLSQKLANFTKGQADSLRKAMGKKLKEELDKMKGLFMEGAQANGHPADKLEKIWTDWEAFASYAFNKSHSTCYAWIAFQTGYLKAHYPAEYMAAAMTGSLSDLKTVTFFIQDCKRNKIPVLGPDVNESYANFSVNQEGAIRFGLAAIKGVGESAVESIVEERKKGPFTSVFDFMRRIDTRTNNKRVLEGLVLSGAMDSFGIPRSAYFAVDVKNIPYLETLVKYSNASRNSNDNAMNSLFGDATEISIPEPAIPSAMPWDPLTQLSREKEVSGIFLSGHPLDGVKMEMENFSTPGGMGMLNNLTENMGKELRLAGMIKSVNHMMSKNGKPFGRFVLEDFDSEHEFSIYGDDYVKFKNYLEPNYQIMIVGKVQSRGWKSDANQPPQLEYKITQILLLNEVLEKWGKYITIKVDAEQITSETIQQLQAYLTPSDGTAQLRVHLDYQGETTKTISGNVSRIKISEELMEKLNRLPHVAATITPA